MLNQWNSNETGWLFVLELALNPCHSGIDLKSPGTMGRVTIFKWGNWGNGSSIERMQYSASWTACTYHCNAMHANKGKEILNCTAPQH